MMGLVYRTMMKFLILNSWLLIPHYFYSSYLVGSGMPA